MEKEITRHSNDIIMKSMAETFKDKTLHIFGLDTAKIKAVIPSEVPVVEVKDNRTDYIFLLEDDTLLHLEFMTTVSQQALYRFLLYDARLINRDKRQVNTAVIYSGRIDEAPGEIDRGSLRYKVTNIYMKSYDGDQEYIKLQQKIIANQPFQEEDILKLIFLPLMKSGLSEDQMAIQAAQLAKEIPGEIKTLVIGALLAVTDRFMAESNKRKLLEVLKMTQIEQWIREEGIKEGIKEGETRGKLEVAKNMLQLGMDVDTVYKVTGLSFEQVEEVKKQLQ